MMISLCWIGKRQRRRNLDGHLRRKRRSSRRRRHSRRRVLLGRALLSRRELAFGRSLRLVRQARLLQRSQKWRATGKRKFCQSQRRGGGIALASSLIVM